MSLKSLLVYSIVTLVIALDDLNQAVVPALGQLHIPRIIGMHAVVRHGFSVEAGPAIDVADGTLRGGHLGRPRGGGLVELHDPVGAVGAPGWVHGEDLCPLSTFFCVRAWLLREQCVLK